MGNDRTPEAGTLVVSALLLTALAYAGYWIVYSVREREAPWSSVLWFGIVEAAIVVLGILVWVVTVRSRRP